MNHSTLSEVGITVGGRAAWRKRLDNALLIGIPLAGALYACYYFTQHDVHWFAVAQLFFWYFFTGIGIGVGFHRQFSHKSFNCTPLLRALLGIAGSMAFQGTVTRWIADHRRHHRFTDEDPDTHTPHRYDTHLQRFVGTVKNLWHAHVGWMFDATTTRAEVYAPDMLRDPLARALTKWYVPILGLSMGLPWVLGYLVGGSEVAFQSLLLGCFVRTVLLHNVIWAVNSIGHTFGDQSATQHDESRNNWVLAVLTFGEGWHNNHHASPRCAYNNWTGKEWDVNGGIIRLGAKLGWIWDVYTRRIVRPPRENQEHLVVPAEKPETATAVTSTGINR